MIWMIIGAALCLYGGFMIGEIIEVKKNPELLLEFGADESIAGPVIAVMVGLVSIMIVSGFILFSLNLQDAASVLQ